MGRGRPSLAVTGTEFRRTVRAVSGNRTKLLLMTAVAMVALGPITAVGLVFLPTLGEEAAAGTLSSSEAAMATDLVTGGVAVLWVALVGMTVMRTITTVADLDEPAFLLLSTSVRNTVVGVVGAEIALVAVWTLPPVVLLAAAFASGVGTVLPVVTAPLVLGFVLFTAVPVGFAAGIWIRHAITVYEPIARYRTLLFAGFWLVYFGVIATGELDAVTSTLFARLQTSPVGWPGHLLLLGIPGIEPSVTGIGGTVVGSALGIALALAVATAGGRTHWFADPARPDDEVDAEASSDRLEGLLSGPISRPVRTVTVTAIRRTKRSPIRLAYAGYPLLGILGFVQQIIEAGTIPPYMALLFSLYVVWAAGVLFTLNPLGDLGPGLPAVLTSTLTGRQAIRGRIVASALVSVPLALLVSLAVGLVSPLSLERTAALVTGTVVGAVVTPALATGIGSAFPRFGSVTVTNNREAVMPSKTAFFVYTLAIALPTVAAVVIYLEAPELIANALTTVAAWTPAPALSISARSISIGAWIVLIGGLVAPLVSYRYAIERFDWYVLE
ncbi:hypothetical protein [Natrinema longum]|uniref:ABC-2 type transport system permease protein n=1 Tax=Natrinema longum TaxID=370324 RepID=A0A8A2U6T8_9EURY|nr:hypothetical protein [Natrinema longum]MBZ6494265.1 hypothetical protein [Natrinema longum]QSW84410.1 hypothetical protein J0X27_13245 [Natrinema longum]